MKKFEPILDDEGNILITSDEVARGVSFYEAWMREATGAAFKGKDGSVYEVLGLDLERGYCVVAEWAPDLSTGGTWGYPLSRLISKQKVKRFHLCGRCGINPHGTGQPAERQARSDAWLAYCKAQHGDRYSCAFDTLFPCDSCGEMHRRTNLLRYDCDDRPDGLFKCGNCR